MPIRQTLILLISLTGLTFITGCVTTGQQDAAYQQGKYNAWVECAGLFSAMHGIEKANGNLSYADALSTASAKFLVALYSDFSHLPQSKINGDVKQHVDNIMALPSYRRNDYIKNRTDYCTRSLDGLL